MAPTDASTYKETLLRETREELARADTKASILLGASAIAFGALFKDPDKLNHHTPRTLGWIALALTLVGICFVAAAVKPRLRAKHAKSPRPHYFGDVEAYRPPWGQIWRRRRHLEKARRRFGTELAEAATAAEYEERLTDQIWHLSHIAYRKYRFVSIGMWWYAAGLLVGLAALVLEKEWL
jgi:hypothetical protein